MQRRPNATLRAVVHHVLTFVLALGLTGCVDGATEHRVRANALFRGGDYTAAVRECDLGPPGRTTSPPSSSAGRRSSSWTEWTRRRVTTNARRGSARGRARAYMGDVYLGLAIIASREKDWEGAGWASRSSSPSTRTTSVRTPTSRASTSSSPIPKAEEHAEFAAHARPQDEATLFMLGEVGRSAASWTRRRRRSGGSARRNPRPLPPYGLAMVAARRGDEPRALAKSPGGSPSRCRTRQRSPSIPCSHPSRTTLRFRASSPRRRSERTPRLPATFLEADHSQQRLTMRRMTDPISRISFERAQRVIPGGVNSPVRAFRAVGGSRCSSRAREGAYLYGADGAATSTTSARGGR